MPEMKLVNHLETFYTLKKNIFMVKVEVQFADKPKPFVIVDRVIVNDNMEILKLESYFNYAGVKGGKPGFAAMVDEFIEE